MQQTPIQELIESSPSDNTQSIDKEFQKRVVDWMMECFSMEITRNTMERNHRFLEESLELVQSLGCTKSEAMQLVDYVFAREIGEPIQEVGGVMVTLAALCNAADLNMTEGAETELARIWTKIDKIREKQAKKPKHSPLPSTDNTQIRDDGYSMEDIENAIEFGCRQHIKNDYINLEEQDEFIRSLK